MMSHIHISDDTSLACVFFPAQYTLQMLDQEKILKQQGAVAPGSVATAAGGG